jgi:tetratricopeptide (TPR) repeat protein
MNAIKRILTGLFFVLILASNIFAANYKIIILPFDKLNKEPNSELETLSIGISDILSGALTNVSNFNVIDSARVKRYLLDNIQFDQNVGADSQNNIEKLQKLAQEKLQGDFLVYGSFQKVGNQINFTAKFVKVDEGKIVKSVSVHGAYPDNIFSIQEELAAKLVDAINGKTEKTRQDEIQKKRMNEFISSTENFTAYQYYIKARVEHLKYSMSDYPKALEYYQKAIDTDPKYALAWAGLCEVNAMRAYQILYASGNYKPIFELAIKQGIKAVELGKNLYQTHRALSIAYLNSSDFDKANLAIEPAYNLNNNDAEILWVKAMLTNYDYKEMGKEGTESSGFVRQALKINPDLIVAIWSLAHSYYTLEEYDKALPEYLRIVELNPKQSQALHTIALIYYNQSNYEDTVKYAQMAIDEEAGVPQAHYTLGLGYFMLKDWKNCRNALKEAIKLNPKYTDAIYTLGSAYYNDGDYENALINYEKALKVDPNYSDARTMIKQTKEKLNR